MDDGPGSKPAVIGGGRLFPCICDQNQVDIGALPQVLSSEGTDEADCQDALSNILDAEEKIREALGDVEDTNLPYLSDVRAQVDAAADMDTNVANL